MLTLFKVKDKSKPELRFSTVCNPAKFLISRTLTRPLWKAGGVQTRGYAAAGSTAESTRARKHMHTEYVDTCFCLVLSRQHTSYLHSIYVILLLSNLEMIYTGGHVYIQ